MKKRILLYLLAGSVALAAVPLASAAEEKAVDFGVRSGVDSQVDSGFFGAEVLASLGQAWYFNPNVEYAVGDNRNLLSLNTDFHYDFLRENSFDVWAGAGPVVMREDRDSGTHDTDLGVNVLAGIGGKGPGVRPYGQTKVRFSNDTEAAVAFGLRW